MIRIGLILFLLLLVAIGLAIVDSL